MAKGLYDEWLKEENLKAIAGWARNGLTMEQIAKNIGISRKTLNAWINKYPEIEKAVRVNRERADLIVENEVFKRAQGYTVTVKKQMKIRCDKIQNGVKISVEELVPVEEEVHIPADVKAQVFWLSHRKPEEWGKNAEEQEDATETRSIVEIPGVVANE